MSQRAFALPWLSWSSNHGPPFSGSLVFFPWVTCCHLLAVLSWNNHHINVSEFLNEALTEPQYGFLSHLQGQPEGAVLANRPTWQVSKLRDSGKGESSLISIQEQGPHRSNQKHCQAIISILQMCCLVQPHVSYPLPISHQSSDILYPLSLRKTRITMTIIHLKIFFGNSST